VKDNINYINFTITEVNDISDELYEALFEEDNEKEVEALADKMISVMKDIKSTLK
jgi:hypothetical protein